VIVEAKKIGHRQEAYPSGLLWRAAPANSPRAANRLLRVEAKARLHTIEFKNLRAGEYTLRAQVLGGDAVRSEATADIMVTGQDPE